MELRKCFDTRAGFWLMASIGIAALLATGAVLLWAPDSELTYSTFATAIGFPMAIILPMVAVLSVTSEWSQRSGLTTFTLVPHRSRAIAAKFGVTVGISVVSMLIAMAIGAVGTVVGSAILGIDPVWDAGFVDLANIVLAQVLGMLVGFMLGVVIRSSSAAIVAYFVYSFALTAITEVLAATQDWFANLQPWVDFNYAQTRAVQRVVGRRAVGQPRRHRRGLAGRAHGVRPLVADAVRGEVARPTREREPLASIHAGQGLSSYVVRTPRRPGCRS